MKDAARIGLRAAIRTLAQTLAGGLAAVSVVSLGDAGVAANAALIAAIGACIAAVVAFLQNFAESLPGE